MTGVLALADYGTYVQYVGMFFGAILLLSGGLIIGRAVFGARREHGNVLDINHAGRAQAGQPR
jgi:hypothetical protein